MRRTVFNWYISWSFIRILKIFSEDLYKKKYRRLLKNMGMDIAQDEYYIDPSAFFDNYEKIVLSEQAQLLKGIYQQIL